MTPAQWRALLERLLGTNKYLEHTGAHQLKAEPWLLAEIGKAALELHRNAVDLLAEMGTGEDSDGDADPGPEGETPCLTPTPSPDCSPPSPPCPLV